MTTFCLFTDRFELLVLLLLATDPFSHCFCSLFLASTLRRESETLTSESFAMCVKECVTVLSLDIIPQHPENKHYTCSFFNISNLIPFDSICNVEFVALQWGHVFGDFFLSSSELLSSLIGPVLNPRVCACMFFFQHTSWMNF